MSSGAGGHSLAFRVMRLCRPAFQVDLPTRVDPIDLMIGEDFLDDPNSSQHLNTILSSHSSLVQPGRGFSKRFEIEQPSDAMGLSGLLVLPQAFGYVMLGFYIIYRLLESIHRKLGQIVLI